MNDFNIQGKILSITANKEYRVKKEYEQIMEAESCVKGEVCSGHTDCVLRPEIFTVGL